MTVDSGGRCAVAWVHVCDDKSENELKRLKWFILNLQPEPWHVKMRVEKGLKKKRGEIMCTHDL